MLLLLRIHSGNHTWFILFGLNWWGLPCWLWDSLKVLASKLGTPLFVPSRRDMGCQSNRVCVGWNIKVPPPKQMVINVKDGLKVIPLKFGTLFGSCFKCNHLGHFAKDCKVA